MDIIGFMRPTMKHTLITLLVAIYLTACSTITPAPTATALPSPTIALTQTPVPTFTLTPTPAAGEIEMKQMDAELPDSFSEWPQYELKDFGDFGLVEGQVPTLEQRREILNAIAKAATGAVRESQAEWDTAGITMPTGWGDLSLASTRQNMMVPFLNGERMKVEDPSQYPELDIVWIMGVKDLYKILWQDQLEANGIANVGIADAAIVVRPMVMGEGEVVLIASIMDARFVDFANYSTKWGFKESNAPYREAGWADKTQKVRDGAGVGPLNWLGLPVYNWAGNKTGGTLGSPIAYFVGQDMDPVTKTLAEKWKKEGKTSGVLSPALVEAIESTMWTVNAVELELVK
jgi:hypothetical protein